MALKSLFVTRIYESSLAEERGFPAFNQELEEACRMLAAEDAAGRAWCREKTYPGYTSYASLDDLPRRASVFAQLKTRLDRHARAYAEALQLDHGAGRLRLDSLWVNNLKSGGSHTSHIHPHSV
ncbi:MAG: TIGR02466 family protein, partial [Phenylobacterium sp.]|uniref:TIGR02466 family protein n=1 Tax=Phenylobacterium sp. TaxID=1871053 RepID=UPI002A367863